MPNTKPQTTTLETLDDKFELASHKSHVNYSFFFGATNNNTGLLSKLNRTRVPGVKLFMGASTGNMLVDKPQALDDVFKACADNQLLLMTHCEDSSVINNNMAEALEKYGADPEIRLHPVIRSSAACYKSSELAVQLARQFGTKLHIAHISTAGELNLLDANRHTYSAGLMPQITGEAVLAHLLFSEEDYSSKGALIKCNPAVKTLADRDALRHALYSGRITCIGTDHNPARLFGVCDRGFLRTGYKADITIVKKGESWKVTEDIIQSKCKWSPLQGEVFTWRVVDTFCNGHHVYNHDVFDDSYCGEEVKFSR